MDDWPAVSLTYDPDEKDWTGVVVSDLTTFSGSLFSVLSQMEEHINSIN